jgi:protein TonB
VGNSRGLIIGMVLGAIITVGLFMLMRTLIESNDEPPPKPETRDPIKVTRETNPPETPPEPPAPPQPPDDELPPPPPPKPTTTRPPTGGTGPVPTPPPPGPPDGGSLIIDMDPQPIFRIEPDYPLSELRREREGDVTVEFTITEDGEVTDIRVIEATSDAFARSVVRAVAQWKYAPQISSGQKVTRSGIRVTLNFRIGEDD